jgi:hypothetical protein
MTRDERVDNYYEYHESKESLMDDGHRDKCDECGAVINLDSCHDWDGLNLCEECFDLKNEEAAEEPDEPEEA